MRTSVNAVRVLRSERDPSWQRATDGNIQSLRVHQKYNDHIRGRFVFGMASGREPVKGFVLFFTNLFYACIPKGFIPM